jgi:hypothetical protein
MRSLIPFETRTDVKHVLAEGISLLAVGFHRGRSPLTEG